MQTGYRCPAADPSSHAILGLFDSSSRFPQTTCKYMRTSLNTHRLHWRKKNGVDTVFTQKHTQRILVSNTNRPHACIQPNGRRKTNRAGGPTRTSALLLHSCSRAHALAFFWKTPLPGRFSEWQAISVLHSCSIPQEMGVSSADSCGARLSPAASEIRRAARVPLPFTVNHSGGDLLKSRSEAGCSPDILMVEVSDKGCTRWS